MMNLPAYPQLFSEAIRCFIEKGQTIEGIYDLLLRGGASHAEHIYVDNWSDLDLSLIVDQINENVLKQYRWVYDEIKSIFPYKLSITLVTKNDFMSSQHYHGIKPVYYNQILQDSISLLRKHVHNKALPSLHEQRRDCLANIAYLIHELLGRWLQVDHKSHTSLHQYFCHATKRAKHMVRNSLFIITGTIDEEIDPDLFQKTFPMVMPNFPECLKTYKENFENYALSDAIKEDDLKKKIIGLLTILEQVYERVIYFADHHLILEGNFQDKVVEIG